MTSDYRVASNLKEIRNAVEDAKRSLLYAYSITIENQMPPEEEILRIAIGALLEAYDKLLPQAPRGT